MKNIVLFIPTLSIAGAEKFVLDLALNLDKKKYNVTVATTRGLSEIGFQDILTDYKISVINFNCKNLIAETIKIYNFLKYSKIDIIHANIGSLLHVMIAVILYRPKVKIFTFHSVASRAAAKSRIKKILYSFAFKQLKFIPVAVSDYVKMTIAEEYGIPVKLIPCIYNGVDTKLFTPKLPNKHTHSNNEREVHFVSTGTLYYVKNHRLLIEAFAETEKLYPDITLSIIGDGELRQELELLIKEYGLKSKISLVGVKKNVVDYLHISDIYIMSSNFEGLPLSMLEAMACGLPIITTRAGGIVDIVKNGQNGLITAVGDEKALSKSMVKLITDPNLRCAMGENSRKRALELDIHNCVDKYERLYEGGFLNG